MSCPFRPRSIGARTRGGQRPCKRRSCLTRSCLCVLRLRTTTDPMAAGLLRPLRDSIKRYLGEAAGQVIVPSIAIADRTHERLLALLAFIREAGVGNAASASPYFGLRQDEARARVIQGIHQAIAGRDVGEVVGGAGAIENWVARASNGDGPLPPQQLIDRIISTIESGREVGLGTLSCTVRKRRSQEASCQSRRDQGLQQRLIRCGRNGITNGSARMAASQS